MFKCVNSCTTVVFFVAFTSWHSVLTFQVIPGVCKVVELKSFPHKGYADRA